MSCVRRILLYNLLRYFITQRDGKYQGIFLAVEGEDKFLDRVAADIPRIRSALHVFLHAI
jgi:hypothetical protein